jgi:hypothetical protein
MEYRCAWCGQNLAQVAKPGCCTSISHGICNACMQAMLNDLDVPNDSPTEQYPEAAHVPRQAA